MRTNNITVEILPTTCVYQPANGLLSKVDWTDLVATKTFYVEDFGNNVSKCYRLARDFGQQLLAGNECRVFLSRFAKGYAKPFKLEEVF